MIQVSEAGQDQPKPWHIWSRAWVLGFFGAEDVEKLNCWPIFKNLEVTQREWEISGLSSEIISPDRISHILGWQQQGASWRPILGQALSSRGFPSSPPVPAVLLEVERWLSFITLYWTYLKLPGSWNRDILWKCRAAPASPWSQKVNLSTAKSREASLQQVIQSSNAQGKQ